jgi:cysteine desulfuration protein SufE
MESSFEEKVLELKKRFALLLTPDARYELLMQMGRELPPFASEWKIPENQVPGCQSILYLKTTLQEGRLFFAASSDALISAGLAALLIALYSGQTPEEILLKPPTILEELGIYASLSLNRSNGLNSIHLKMKREALQYLKTLTKK